MLTGSMPKFGGRTMNKRIGLRQNSEGIVPRGSLKTSVHATNRPWHTSTAGIRMSVNKLGQVANAAGPKAVKYLNQMRLSEAAQRPRGLSTDPSTLDRTGVDSVKGLRHSISQKMSNMAPDSDTIRRWSKSMTDQHADLRSTVGSRLGVSTERAGVMMGTGTAPGEVSHYTKQYNAITSRISELKKMKPRIYW